MQKTAVLNFPPDFLWGTAASSHQVEGNNNNNDWWEWEQQGKINDGSVSGPACDHYNRFDEDFAALRRQHHNTHRLSIEWSRIEPEQGRWNKQAVKHYKAVLASLKSKGLKPMLTLHHFTNPLWLSRQGGWEQPQVVRFFKRYARFVAEELGEGIELWITINEPVVYAFESYIAGIWPPGKRDFKAAMRVLKHMLLAHAEAYHAIHSVLTDGCKVSFAKHYRIFDPFCGCSIFDRTMAYVIDFIFNRHFTKACIGGTIYPPVALFKQVPRLKNTLDYIGINYYSREMIRFTPFKPGSDFFTLITRPGAPVNFLGWEIYPYGLFRLLRKQKKYKKAIYITENGIATENDEERGRFIIEHLKQMHCAITGGIDVRGYYYWSCLDNFEWAEGFTPRFGLTHVDYKTQKRTLRGSGKLYAEIAGRGKITGDMILKTGYS
ncbi:MAG: glycoside hydrolase family 1 protein [Spirochaetales bacterium]|nr:glycoside hydrolase family 1 protein [Spirochaetales bacterium]